MAKVVPSIVMVPRDGRFGMAYMLLLGVWLCLTSVGVDGQDVWKYRPRFDFGSVVFD